MKIRQDRNRGRSQHGPGIRRPAAFLPAVLALGGDLGRAKRLQDSSYKMWNLNGIEPEVLDYRGMKVLHPAYPLRPEIMESAYYLHRATKDPQYLEMGPDLLRKSRHPLPD